jgi:hypothetical protein
MRPNFYGRLSYALIVLIVALLATAGVVGQALGSGVLHPANLNPNRRLQAEAMLLRTGASKKDFSVRASDGVELRGWKVRSRMPSANWVLLFHGVSDNRTGVLGHAELLLRHGYNVVMMDARAHGESGGTVATYGWKERYDTVAIADALCSSERVRSPGCAGSFDGCRHRIAIWRS